MVALLRFHLVTSRPMSDAVHLFEADADEMVLFNVSVGTYAAKKSGERIITDIEIFKAGQFKDSMGELQNWTVEQLIMMAANFKMLKDADKLPNVPVRLDHSWSIKDVVGYFVDVRVVGTKLVADIEFTDETALNQYSEGTLRSRSIEIGGYEDNDQVYHWPVIRGLAFVDLPAVEGLHSIGDRSVKSFQFSKEGVVPNPPATDTKFIFKLAGVETSDYAAVQNYVAKLEGDLNDAKTQAIALGTENEQYKLALAAHAETTRANFVEKLAADKKITAPQVAPLKEHALSLSDDQFKTFAASYEAAPPLSLLGDHGKGVTNSDGATGAAIDKVSDDISVFQGIVDRLRQSGMPEEKIVKTGAYQSLVALKTGA